MSAVLSHTDAAELFCEAHKITNEYHLLQIQNLFEQVSKDRDTISDRHPTFSTDREEFLKALKADADLNFIHDIKSGIFLWDVYGWHTAFLNQLGEVLLNCKPSKHGYAGETPGDKYISKGLGWFRSSCSYRVTISENIAAPRWLQLDYDYVD